MRYRNSERSQKSVPVDVNFRSKKTGWSNYQYSLVFKYSQGNEYSVRSGQDLYMKLFVGDYITRKSCASCKFKGIKRVSDITLGDFWGIWDLKPDIDDNRGISLVLIHSKKGRDIWEDISSNIKSEKATVEEAIYQNQSILKTACLNDKYDETFELIEEEKWDVLEQWFEPPNSSFLSKIRRKLCGLVRL